MYVHPEHSSNSSGLGATVSCGELARTPQWAITGELHSCAFAEYCLKEVNVVGVTGRFVQTGVTVADGVSMQY